MWSNPEIVLLGIQATIAFIYAIVTGLIWHATWQNTKATRQILEAAHRPYVAVVSAQLEYTTSGGPINLRGKN